MNVKTVDDYIKLPYTIEVIRDENEDDPGWVARVLELPGCITQADNFEELGEMIEDAMRGWLEIALEDSIPIPEPRPEESYSGKFVVRVPKSLHCQLVEEAEREGVSLNQYINVALAQAVTSPMNVAQRTVEATSSTNWPGLSAAASDVLRMAGLEDEAGELDERMFADWVARMLSQIESAWIHEYYQEVLKYQEHMTVFLRQHMDRSPAIESLVLSLEFQRDLLKYAIYTRQTMAPQTMDRALENRFPYAYRPRPEPSTTSDKRDLYEAQIRESSDEYEVSEDYRKLIGQGNDE